MSEVTKFHAADDFTGELCVLASDFDAEHALRLEAERQVGELRDSEYNAQSDSKNSAALLEEVLEFFDDGVGRSPEEFKLMRRIDRWLHGDATSTEGKDHG